MARLALVVLALVFLAGCGAADSSASGVVPFKPLPPNTTPPPVPSPEPWPILAGTPACTASMLQGVAVRGQGATGNWEAGFLFAGSGKGECYLEGTPAVTLFDTSGQEIPFKVRAPYFPPQQPGPAPVAPGPIPEAHTALKLGQASLIIEWVTQPEPCPGEAGVVVGTAKIVIPAGGTLWLAIPRQPAAYVCQGLGVGAFEAPVKPVPDLVPNPPDVSLDVPASVAAGKELIYTATLTNNQNATTDLKALCPTLEEELFADLAGGSPPLSGKHFYSLNCAAASNIARGRSEQFQMIFDVPADATPGTYTLIFGLGYWNSMTRNSQHQVTVTAG